MEGDCNGGKFELLSKTVPNLIMKQKVENNVELGKTNTTGSKSL